MIHRAQEFQRAHGKVVHVHESVLLYACHLAYVPQLGVLCVLQVLHYGTAGYGSCLEVLYAIALQVLHAEVLEQLAPGCLLVEYPVLHLEGNVLLLE